MEMMFFARTQFVQNSIEMVCGFMKLKLKNKIPFENDNYDVKLEVNILWEENMKHKKI